MYMLESPFSLVHTRNLFYLYKAGRGNFGWWGRVYYCCPGWVAGRTKSGCGYFCWAKKHNDRQNKKYFTPDEKLKKKIAKMKEKAVTPTNVKPIPTSRKVRKVKVRQSRTPKTTKKATGKTSKQTSKKEIYI